MIFELRKSKEPLVESIHSAQSEILTGSQSGFYEKNNQLQPKNYRQTKSDSRLRQRNDHLEKHLHWLADPSDGTPLTSQMARVDWADGKSDRSPGGILAIVQKAEISPINGIQLS